LPFYVTSYLNEEVTCTEPSPLVSVPWCHVCIKIAHVDLK
jgi:hypothetical protein